MDPGGCTMDPGGCTMDPGGCTMDPGGCVEQTEGFWTHHVMEESREEDAPWRLVDVLLSGGAPWGFTLRGGREHREPLLITKVEENSRAAAVSLQAGDELVNINEIPLTGSRQEAICLVKGSHKTLALVVKRHMHMVDIVAQKMPSESDVHVARSFLTKILRSSMRRSEPISRPHSWHSTKFNESPAETTKTQSAPTQAWHTRYDASSSSTDLSSGWEQTNLRRVSDQFSSLGSMDSLEQPYSSSSKSHCSSQETLDPGGGGGGGGGGGKRDSAYSSFSTSSGTPDYTLSKSNTTSTENMLYKVSQWDSVGQQAGSAKPHGGGGVQRHSQQEDRPGYKQEDRPGYKQEDRPGYKQEDRPGYKQEDRVPGYKQEDRPGYKQEDRVPGYLHVAGGRDSPHLRSESPLQAGSRHSSTRASCGPVWHVPERKKNAASPSPPPPPPPVRSDSFAATTKVQERGLVIAYPESPAHTHAAGVVYPKAHEKAPAADRRPDLSDNAKRGRSSSHVVPPPKSDADQFYFTPDNNSSNPTQLGSNRQYSLSSSDVRQGPPSQPYSQWHYSGDKSTVYPQTQAATAAAAKPKQSVSGYYSSMQELPTAGPGPLYSQGRNPNPAVPQGNQNPDSTAHRYYCVAARQPGGPPLLGKTEDHKKDAAGTEATQGANDGQAVNKAKYHPPQQQQQHVVHIKNTNGYSKQEDILSSAAVPEASLAKPCPDHRAGQRVHINSQTVETPSYASRPSEQRRSLPASLQPQQQPEPPAEGRLPKQDVFPRTTAPMLHSLSADNPAEDPWDPAAAADPLEGKQVRRADRFATTLRNEIQMRRAALQKSVSAAALTGGPPPHPEDHDEDELGSAPSSSYKDHLKEAQARVLKATSFRRRDLEIPNTQGSVAPPPPLAYGSSSALRKGAGSLPSVSLSVLGAGGKGAGPPVVTRIGGRKRFPQEKKARSFSEPDKIHEVGTMEEQATPPPESHAYLEQHTGKPSFPKPPPMQYYYEDPQGVLGSAGQPEGPGKGTQCRGVPPPPAAAEHVAEDGSALHGAQTALAEQQRLGTFAEYEARWNVQKKPSESSRASGGRYHSADNILEPEEVTTPSCFHHERSRSSPSADLHRQKPPPAPGRKSAEYSQQEEQPAELSGSHASSLSARGPAHCAPHRAEDQPSSSSPAEPAAAAERFPPPMTGPPDLHGRPPAAPVYHRPPSVSHSPPVDPSSSSSEAQGPPPPGGQKKKKAPVPLPKPHDSRRPEVAPPAVGPQNHPPAAAAAPLSSSSVNGGLGPSPGPAHYPETDRGGPGAAPRPAAAETASSDPQPASPPATPPRSSSSTSPAPPALPPPPALAAIDVQRSVDAAQRSVDAAGHRSAGHRSPSPQFSPQRLSDKPPPVSLQDESCSRMDSVMSSSISNSAVVKKVPIKIVHSESSWEKESRQYLLLSSDADQDGGGGSSSPPAMEYHHHQGGIVLPVPGTTAGTRLGGGGSAEQQDYSVFCAYTRPSAGTPEALGDHPGGPPSSGEAGPLPPDANNKPLATADPHTHHGPTNGSRSPEDMKRQELVRDIMDKDKSLDILDQSRMRTTMDLMEGIFPGGEHLLEEAHLHHLHHHHHHNHHRKAGPKQPSNEDRTQEDCPLVTSSTYYSTSAPKAELLIKMKDMQEEEEEDSEDELDMDLANKKQELMDSLSRKLLVLREARESLQEDLLDNKALGEEVEATVQRLCKPNELDKFRMFVGDLDKVVSLLLSLSGRLARVENALNSPDEDTTPEERRTLTEKRALLIRQHEDAKELKDNLDRRERVVDHMVALYLDQDGLADYQHFVKMKSALIIEQRKLEDKIKLGEEQLKCLMDSLPLEQRLNL